MHDSAAIAEDRPDNCCALPAMAADDNLLAHRLFEAGDFVRAAEIFTDPAWKGVALYRSDQWWRAAEAFVRANDPVVGFQSGKLLRQAGLLRAGSGCLSTGTIDGLVA